MNLNKFEFERSDQISLVAGGYISISLPNFASSTLVERPVAESPIDRIVFFFNLIMLQRYWTFRTETEMSILIMLICKLDSSYFDSNHHSITYDLSGMGCKLEIGWKLILK